MQKIFPLHLKNPDGSTSDLTRIGDVYRLPSCWLAFYGCSLGDPSLWSAAPVFDRQMPFPLPEPLAEEVRRVMERFAADMQQRGTRVVLPGSLDE